MISTAISVCNDDRFVFNVICFVGVHVYFGYVYLFTHIDVHCGFHMICCSHRLAIIRRATLIEQELLTLPKGLSVLPDIIEVRSYCSVFNAMRIVLVD